MKTRIMLFIVMLLAAWQGAAAEVDLEVVWQKYIFPAEISFAKWSADGNFIYCAVGNNIHKMDAKTGEFVSAFQNDDVLSIASMDISKQGNYIVTNNGDGAVNIWDTRIEHAVKKIQLGVASVVISPNEEYLVIGSARTKGKEIIIYDFINEKEIVSIPFVHAPVALAFSHDGTKFATGTYYKDDFSGKYFTKVVLWRTDTWNQIAVIEDNEYLNGSKEFRALKFSFDDKLLGIVTSSNWPLARIYDLETRKVIVNSEFSKWCFNLAFLPDLEHFFFFYADVDYYMLDLHDLNKKIKSYHYRDEIIEPYGSPESWKVFYGGGRDTFYLFKNTVTGIQTPEITLSPIRIFSDNGKVLIESSESFSEPVQISITDVLGKLIHMEKMDILQVGRTELKIILPSGFYICKINSAQKEYSQKIEIVR